MLDYFKVRLARAYTDLKASVRANLPGSFIAAAGAAIALPGIGMFAGADPQQELRLLIAYSFLGPVALIPIMYVVFYLRAGPKIYAEQRAQILAAEAANGMVAIPKGPVRNVTVGEAVAFLMTKAWGRDFEQELSTPEADSVAEFRRFHQAAADGLVTVWGRPGGVSSVYEPIPPAFWIKNDVNFSSVLKGAAESEPHLSKDTSQQRYLRLMTSRSDTEQLFQNQPEELRRAKTVARQLTKLLDKGVNERNALLQRVEAFDDGSAKGTLVSWNDEVLSKFDSAGVPEDDRSRFSTLNTFYPEIHGEPGRDPRQEHLETIWNKKLQILRTIVNNMSIDLSHRTG